MKKLPSLHTTQLWCVLTLATMDVPLAAPAATHVWTGGAANRNWNHAANWSSSGVPSAAEANCVIEFAPSFTGPATNNIPGLRVDALRLLGSGVTLYGGPNCALTLKGTAGTNLHNAGLNYFMDSLPLALEGTNRINAMLGLGLYTRLAGTGGLEIRGTVRMDGEWSNIHQGRTVLKSGLLVLGKELDSGNGPVGLVSIPHELIVEEGTVSYASDHGIADSVIPEIQPGATLNLNGHDDAIGGLTLTGGTVETGSGLLTVEGKVWARAFGATINGRLSLGGETRVFECDSLATLGVNAVISTGGNLAQAGLWKIGGGVLRLAGNNSFNGRVSVDAGTLEVAHAGALGQSFLFGTTVASDAFLRLADGVVVAAEALTLNGGSFYGQGAATWAGPVILAADSHLRSVTANGNLQVNGVISGPGGFTHAGPGRLTFGGMGTNSYAGDTHVEAGVLYLNKPDSVRAASGRLYIGNEAGTGSASVRFFADYPLGSPSRVTIRSDGVLEVNGQGLVCGHLEGSGRVTLGNGFINLSGGDFAGTISGAGAINKFINSTLRFSGTNTYSGRTTIKGGGLTVDGALTASTVHAEPGTWLAGRGYVFGAVLDQATLTSGYGPFNIETMKLGSLVMTNQSTYRVETRASPAGGWDRDSVEVSGLTRITGSRLDLRLGAAGNTNIGYMILKLTGADAIQGTFDGWPQGGRQTVAGAELEIDYFSGTGNDVVLRQRSLATNDYTVWLQIQRPDAYTTHLIWPGFASNYELQTCTNLSENAWINTPAYRLSDGTNIIALYYTYPWLENPPQRFFRLRQPEQ